MVKNCKVAMPFHCVNRMVKNSKVVLPFRIVNRMVQTPRVGFTISRQSALKSVLLRLVFRFASAVVLLCSHLHTFLCFNKAFFTKRGITFGSVVDLIAAVISTMTLDFLVSKWTPLCRGWDKLYQMTGSLRNIDACVLQKCKIYCSISLLYLLFNVILVILKASTLSNMSEHHLEGLSSMYFGLNVTHVQTMIAFNWVNGILMCLGSDLHAIVIPTALGCIYLLFSQLFRNVNRELKDKSLPSYVDRQLKNQEIVVLRKKYKYLQDFVEDTDKMLCVINLAWFSTSFITICQGIRELILRMDTNPTLCIVQDAITHSRPLLLTGFLAFCASQIPETVDVGFRRARDLTLSCKYAYPEVHGEVLLLLSQLSTPPTGMTIGGSFLITKTTFLSHLAGVASYVVILLQLYPDMMKKLRGRGGIA